MDKRVEVSFEQAMDFYVAGFDVKCYVLAETRKRSGSMITRVVVPEDLIPKKKRTKIFRKDSVKIAYVKGRQGPKYGSTGVVWRRLYDKYWANNKDKIVRLGVVRKAFTDAGLEKSNAVQLINHYKVLKEVE